jgi:hypothetical protein
LRISVRSILTFLKTPSRFRPGVFICFSNNSV